MDKELPVDGLDLQVPDALASNTTCVQMRGDDYAYLRSRVRPRLAASSSPLNVVDLFCGAGGISLGIVEAANSYGIRPLIKWAVDFDERAVSVFRQNFPEANCERRDLSEIFEQEVSAKLTRAELALRRKVGEVQLLVGGPPCQGHSDLNNYSRRADPKNSLYVLMARAAKVLRPSAVLIENVPGARHDRGGAVHTTICALEELGYRVRSGIVDMRQLGVPQSRRRFILIATKEMSREIPALLHDFRCEPRTVRWAIEDLVNEPGSGIANMPATSAPATRSRIDYLFDNDLFELPDGERPPCHRNGGHSYKSIYGRLRWEDCAQTITSGFYSMCMGRYVHPSQRRTLTAHEAARIQFFPDFFSFTSAGNRTALAQIVGNAVPPKFSFAIGRALLPHSVRT
jgi:DNA (cytosine-5)-methyltransferase 1